MPVVRIRWRDFTKGWWGTGARDAQPESTLRRAVGIHYTKTTELRSRYGCTVLANLDAHSVARYNHHRYMGVGTEFWVDGLTMIQGGLDGSKLTCVRAQPTVDVEDYLFVAGGGLLFKVGPDNVTSLWGIEPPPNGFLAGGNAAGDIVIDEMETAAGWAAVSCVLADEATIKQQGTNAMKMTVAASTTGTATKANTLNLATFGSGAGSLEEDFISLWVRVDHPERVEALTLSFDVAGTTFASDYYVRDVVPSEQRVAPGQLSTQTGGIAAYRYSPVAGQTVAVLPDANTGEWRLFTISPDGGISQQVHDPAVLAEFQGGTTQSFLPATLDTWTHVRLPKSTFARVGGGAGTWATVQAVKIQMRTNAVGEAIAYLDAMHAQGGVGLQGTYTYHVTYLNAVTGTRSNPNPTPVVVPTVARGGVTLTNLPESTDPQVTHVEIFRTVGNGTLHFKVGEVTNGTTLWVDEVSDAATLDSRPDVALMTDIELPFDNLRPDDEWDDVFGPYAGCLFWTRSPIPGERGKVFFSPPGRTEVAGGYITISSDDEPALKGVVFNGSAYVWTTKGIYQITGAGPFSSRRVYGVPGTLWPLAVALTPYGVAYLANDGPRIFDGNTSKLIANAPISLLFRDESVENIRLILDA